jgi:putative FmdB family regulatory protein
MMPLFEYECPKCKAFFEWIAKFDEVVKCPLCFDVDAVKVFPTSSPSFKLVYNNKTDMCDWDGNTSQYWTKYKEMKAEGKKPRIPALDGDDPHAKDDMIKKG